MLIFLYYIEVGVLGIDNYKKDNSKKTIKINKKKKKDEHLSEVDLAEFFLDYKKRYSSLKETLLISVLFYFIFGLYGIYYNLLFPYGMISLLVIVFGILYLAKFKMINFKQYDTETIDDFIHYLEPQNNQVKKKGRKKKESSFNEIVGIIEKIQQDYYIKTINRSGSIFLYYIINILFISPFFIFVTGLPIINAYPNLFGTLSELINDIILNTIPIIGVILYSIIIVYLYSKVTDFNNVLGCSELFKSRVEQNLNASVKVLKSFLKNKTKNIKPKETNLIPSLQQWYDFYCSHFSTHDKLNEIISKYYKFIFSTKNEFFYLKLFSEVKGKLIDYEKIQSYQEKNQNTEGFKKALDMIENYIEILTNSIDINIQRKKEQRERWNTIKTFLY